MSDTRDAVLEFWNQRAGLGEWAGTNDIVAKRLEMETLAGFVADGMRVLDVGCGNGITAMELARRFAVDITGIDFSPEMIAAARELSAGQSFRGRIDFVVGKVPGIVDRSEGVDLAYTERTIINLPTWNEQQRAIAEIGRLLKPGGRYLMCENSLNGLNELNDLRVLVGLPRIEPPWHNRYLIDEEIDAGSFGGLRLDRTVYYSS
ncbi:MAG TPA: class I SAM-dependent methyltransferase, partial [Vicinamibacterales bacterium]|nr:class I SAM-dependent methyltransferase [Vicinamibacterales bacterium]